MISSASSSFANAILVIISFAQRAFCAPGESGESHTSFDLLKCLIKNGRRRWPSERSLLIMLNGIILMILNEVHNRSNMIF